METSQHPPQNLGLATLQPRIAAYGIRHDTIITSYSYSYIGSMGIYVPWQ